MVEGGGVKTFRWDYPRETWTAGVVERVLPELAACGWSLDSGAPDLVVCHQDRLAPHLGGSLPIIILERCDGARITGATRKHLEDPLIRLVLKNSRYADLALYNQHTGRMGLEERTPPRTLLSDETLAKIRLGFSYAATEIMAPAPPAEAWRQDRPIRASFAGTTEYPGIPALTRHRKRCVAAVEKVGQAIDGRQLPAAEYWRLLGDSVACVSPHGCGEVCWRCYQGILAGCVLVRPDFGYWVETPEGIYDSVLFADRDWGDLSDALEELDDPQWLSSELLIDTAQRVRTMNTPRAVAVRLAELFDEAVGIQPRERIGALAGQ